MMKKQDVNEAVYQAVFWAVNLGVGRVVGQLRDVHGVVALDAAYWGAYWAVDRVVHVAVHYEKLPHPGLEFYLGGVG